MPLTELKVRNAKAAAKQRQNGRREWYAFLMHPTRFQILTFSVSLW